MNNYKKVLVVEDEEAVRNEISEILTMENFQVSSATNGLEGLIQAKRNKPDIIVSDIIMPFLNGYQFIQRIKKNPETESIPVIFLSAKTTKDDIRHGIYLGAVSYLTKPLSIDELLQTIKKGLNNPQKSRKTNNTNKENRLPNSTTVKKSENKNIEILPVIKKIVIKEAKLLNRLSDIEFLLQAGHINHNHNYFKKMIRHMIRHAINISSKGNKIFVLSNYESTNYRITIKSKNSFNKSSRNSLDYDENKAKYISLGHSIELSMIKSISRLLSCKLNFDNNNNGSFSISILINLSK